MRIVVDLQGAQSSGSRHRGIGRYSLGLVQAMLRLGRGHEFIVALSDRFPDSIDDIRAQLGNLLPRQNIRVWSCLGPTAHNGADNRWRRETAECLREGFLASLDPDVLLVTSLFEGLVDDAVTSIREWLPALPTAVILYDLIPLVQRASYLQEAETAAWYEQKLGHLRRASRVLAISDASRLEGLQHLGLHEHECVSISTAADPRFKPLSVAPQDAARLRHDLGLSRPFVMYTGGIDPRKNVEGLIRAYARLPRELRTQHQLAIVCTIQAPDRLRLQSLAREQGLAEHDLVLTGYVADDDLPALYNLCRLFVFPSWHEGFGLPALEAMACGRAVIGADNSSIPEVIGRADALFDARSDEAITGAMARVLRDDAFRSELEKHGLQRARRFSWEITALRALQALEDTVARTPPAPPDPDQRPLLAYVSPLPPLRSGIAEYSAELLPELARHYRIELVVDQDSVDLPWAQGNARVHDAAWLHANAHRVDRVLYHVGNSGLHAFMVPLLAEIPGVVVLHDFFLSQFGEALESSGLVPDGSWLRRLQASHGHAALLAHERASDGRAWAYPINLDVLQQASGVIVHSSGARRLARDWYGDDADRHWNVVPHLRRLPPALDRAAARQRLGLAAGDFVVCSFGIVGQAKQSRRLLEVWVNSALARDPACRLVFVGANDDGEYGHALRQRLTADPTAARVSISGWLDGAAFRDHLAAADLAVQLRTLSRGETSGAVLDCLAHGVPTIVNANGSMADLPQQVVHCLVDSFADDELRTALEGLWRSPERRAALATSGPRHLARANDPRHCAGLYRAAIEAAHARRPTTQAGIAAAIASVPGRPTDAQAWLDLAEAMALNQPRRPRQRQLLIDVSVLVQTDARTGIQRVVRSVLTQWLTQPPAGWRIEPVYATDDRRGYRYARRFTARFLGCAGAAQLDDDGVECGPGDMMLLLDLVHGLVHHLPQLQQWRRAGLRACAVVYDLLPLQMPQHFPEGVEAAHRAWLEAVAQLDGALCISKAVADEMRQWLRLRGERQVLPYDVRWFRLGADLPAPARSGSLPADAQQVLKQLRSRRCFLMVGTLEPRKGHALALTAFESLWRRGYDIGLTIVGRQGWAMAPLADRLRSHAELGRHLHWLAEVSDEYLGEIYGGAACLLMASEGEGFGLPLIEAAAHDLPVLARRLPVFEEVAGASATYFDGNDPDDLEAAVVAWLQAPPTAVAAEAPTWAQSAASLLVAALGDAVAGSAAGAVHAGATDRAG